MQDDHPVISSLSSALNLDDPTPAWHQLAAIVRWEVARGRLPIGTELPPIRRVAAAVGLHYHTVRRAWTALADEGVLSQRQGRGARIVRAASVTGGWIPADPAREASESPRVWIADSSIERAARLATRLAARWQVVALPYPLATVAPPPGPILQLAGSASAGRWSAREGDITRIDPMLDPATVAVVRNGARLLAADEAVVVSAEGDSPQVAQTLLRQLPRVGLRTRHQDVAAGIDHTGRTLWLHLPIAWERLEWEARSRPDVMAVEFDWAPGPLAGVARRLGWEARKD